MGEAAAPAMGREIVLKVERLAVSFQTAEGALLAVRGVDFDLAAGECLGIVGESGSGKSVCATALLGLLDRTAQRTGTVELGGSDIAAMKKEALRSVRGKAISMIFQEPSRSFDPIYSIAKTFEETFRAKSPEMSRGECRERAVRLLEEVHIPRAEERLKNFPHQFSGGMLQRIMIALALANDPEILIADEPTTSLDVTIQAQIVSLLKELQQSRDLSLIFISHDLRLVSQIADRLMVMYAGLVLELAPTSEVVLRPRSPYTRALLDAVPGWGKHYVDGRLTTIAGGVPDPVRPEPGCPFAPRCQLVREECRIRLPPLEQSEHGVDHLFRCFVEGVKE